MSRVDEMVQLCGQIQAGHRERQEFRANLARTGAARSGSIHASQFAIRAANQARRRTLGETLGAHMSALNAFENGRKQTASESRAARMAFMSKLRQNCAAMAQASATMSRANRAESAASRAAFFGAPAAAPAAKRAGKSRNAAA